jgi:hypothetical protein
MMNSRREIDMKRDYIGRRAPAAGYHPPMRQIAALVIALLVPSALFDERVDGRGAQRQAPGTFRSSVTMVPLDVRVVDERGQPITDLGVDDFTVLEDGVPQVIRQFSPLDLTAAAVTSDRGPTFRTAATETSSAPPDHRVFLIVLGRGRLQGPSKGLSALLDFIEGRLLPQDRVAVLAYNRATDFTTDRRPILEVLSRLYGLALMSFTISAGVFCDGFY